MMTDSPKNPHKEVYQLFGDPADPRRSNGLSSVANFTNTALVKPVVLWEDMMMTVDVYGVPGKIPVYVHLYCPLCARNGRKSLLTIHEGAKEMQIDPSRMPVEVLKKTGMTAEQLATDLGLAPADIVGTISVQKIGCTWEEEPELRRGFGFSVCPWTVVIENNVARNVPR